MPVFAGSGKTEKSTANSKQSSSKDSKEDNGKHKDKSEKRICSDDDGSSDDHDSSDKPDPKPANSTPAPIIDGPEITKDEYPTVYVKDQAILKKLSETTTDDVFFVNGALQIRHKAKLNSDLLANSSVHLGEGSKITGNYQINGKLTRSKKSSIVGETITGLVFPSLSIPQILPQTTNNNILVTKRKSLILDAGNYGILKTEQKATLVLTGGVYHFQDIAVGMHSNIIIQGPTVILVTNKFHFGAHSQVEFFDTTLLPEDFVIYTPSYDRSIVGIHSKFQGTVYTPNGTFHVKLKSKFVGSFYGNSLILGVETSNDFVTSNPDVFCDFELIDCNTSEFDPNDVDQDGYTPAEGDCDDVNPEIFPDADELCDGIDNNCDELIDGLDAIDRKSWYFDFDFDGYGDDSAFTLSCTPPDSFVDNNQDCGAFQPSINPLATERCNDRIDNNCDGRINEGCSCEIKTEICGDGIDQDCNGSDKICDYSDTDQDGITAAAGDCHDNNASVYPGAPEHCDGIDNNCDLKIDEYTAVDTRTWYLDADFDTYGYNIIAIQSCEDFSLFSSDNTDCNDSDPSTNPGQLEFCDGIDNNCNRIIDEECL